VLHTAPGGEIGPAFYTSYLQFARPMTTVMVRAEGDPLALVPALGRAVAEVDPHLALHDIGTMRARASEALATERFATGAIAVFAVLGLTLAAVGLSGVMAYSVAQRRREIGIQLALGATPHGVLRRIVGQGTGLALAGVVLGTAAALGVSSALRALVAGVGPVDPLVLAAVASLLLIVATIACIVPARAATDANPMETLGAE
jgi:ABC-type antimicrobial peptide transport system permease subunit